MNTASVIVLVAVVALAALAVWRVMKKGAPCECGGTRKSCGCGCQGGAGLIYRLFEVFSGKCYQIVLV